MFHGHVFVMYRKTSTGKCHVKQNRNILHGRVNVMTGLTSFKTMSFKCIDLNVFRK